MQRLTDPHYLHTISMTELYQTAYQSRPPINDGLLYAVVFILAGVSPIMSARAKLCGATKSTPARCWTLLWKMIFSASRAVCS